MGAFRDKPERRPLSVLLLRLPRSRAFAGWSILESTLHCRGDALSQLEGIKKDFKQEIDEHPTLKLNLKYIEGQAFLITGNDFNASTIFYQMLNLNSTVSSNGDVILRAKAQHKLGELYEKKQTISNGYRTFQKSY